MDMALSGLSMLTEIGFGFLDERYHLWNQVYKPRNSRKIP